MVRGCALQRFGYFVLIRGLRSHARHHDGPLFAIANAEGRIIISRWNMIEARSCALPARSAPQLRIVIFSEGLTKFKILRSRLQIFSASPSIGLDVGTIRCQYYFTRIIAARPTYTLPARASPLSCPCLTGRFLSYLVRI